ncbi:MAG: Ldh family oxidoreductase [Acetobacterales bacterium]
MDTDAVRLTLPEVHALAMQALTASNVSPGNAQAIADTVTAAERDGCGSHGLMRLPGYVAPVRSGRIDGRATPVLGGAGSTVLKVDGGRGFQAPALRLALEPLVEQTRKSGIAALAISNAHHFGALWYDVEAPAEQGLLAITFVNSRPVMAPAGGREPVFGTNPLAIACPRPGRPPMIFDMASSQSARGEIILHGLKGQPIPLGWALDGDGNPTTDPEEALKGTQLPVGGGAKGAGIALMVELLAAGLTGGNFGFEANAAYDGDGGPSNAGQLIICFDPRRFADPGLTDRVEGLFGRIEGNGDARLPGGRRLEARAESLANGVAVPAGIYQQARALCTP